MVTPADGLDFSSKCVAVVDETSPEVDSRINYVVTATVLVDPEAMKRDLTRMFAGRKNPFHWTREGPEMRNRVLDALIGHQAKSFVRYERVGG